MFICSSDYINNKWSILVKNLVLQKEQIFIFILLEKYKENCFSSNYVKF